MQFTLAVLQGYGQDVTVATYSITVLTHARFDILEGAVYNGAKPIGYREAHVGITQLKRKLRDLKKVEKRLRFGDAPADGKDLVWSRFFSTERLDEKSVKYPLSALQPMDRAQLKCVLEEYFYCLYYEKYKDVGITLQDVYDPALLALFDLPPSAGLDDVKKRFRELAKRYHPDHGGEGEKMIEVLDTYRRLTVDAASARLKRQGESST